MLMTPTDADASLQEKWVEHELPCLKCGYNLSTLRASGNCPECGLPVADSVGTDWLEAAGAATRRRIAAACELMAASLLMAASAIGFMQWGLWTNEVESISRDRAAAAALAIWMIVEFSLWLAAVWMLFYYYANKVPTRRWERRLPVMMIAGVITSVTGIAAAGFGWATIFTGKQELFIASYVLCGVMLLGRLIVITIAGGILYETASLMQTPGLARAIRIVKLFGLISIGLMACAYPPLLFLEVTIIFSMYIMHPAMGIAAMLGAAVLWRLASQLEAMKRWPAPQPKTLV